MKAKVQLLLQEKLIKPDWVAIAALSDDDDDLEVVADGISGKKIWLDTAWEDIYVATRAYPDETFRLIYISDCLPTDTSFADKGIG